MKWLVLLSYLAHRLRFNREVLYLEALEPLKTPERRVQLSGMQGAWGFVSRLAVRWFPSLGIVNLGSLTGLYPALGTESLQARRPQ